MSDSLLIALAPIAGLIFFGSGLIKGLTGIGFITIAVALLSFVVDLPTAIGLSLIPSLCSNFFVMWSAGSFISVASKFRFLYVSTVPGSLLGIYLLATVDPKVSTSLLGVMLISYSIFGLLRPEITICEPSATRLQIPIGLAHGTIAGLTGSQLVPLVPYLLSINLSPQTILQSSNSMFTINIILAGIFLSRGSEMGFILFLASMLCVVPTFLGVAAGVLISRHLSVSRFKPTVLTVLLGLGFAMLHRNFSATVIAERVFFP